MRIWFALLICTATLLAEPPKTQRESFRIPVWSDSPVPLSAENLSATIGGKPANVVRLRDPSEDLMLLVVLDLVGSLHEIDLARDALISTIQDFPPNVHVGVLKAQDGLRVLLDPTTDHSAITNTIKTFNVRGTPGLLESIETASNLADSILTKARVRIAICYITDSDIGDYREDFSNPVINRSDRRDLSRRFPEGRVRERISTLEARLVGRQTPVFIVHLAYNTTTLNEAYQNGLMQLASSTGGDSVFCRSNTEIASAIQNTLNQITSHYGLDLQPPEGASESMEITLEADSNVEYRKRFRIEKN